MSPLTLEDFKDRFIDPNWSPLEMLLEVAQVAAMKYNQECTNTDSCIPETPTQTVMKKPSVVSKITFLGPKKTEARRQPVLPKENHEFMDSDIEGAFRKIGIKNGKKPIIPESDSYLKEDDQAIIMGLRKSKCTHATLLLDEEWRREESLKKAKMSSKSCGSSFKRHNPFKLKQQLPMCPNPPPDLPHDINKKIIEMGGSDVSFVIQKTLFSTDVSPQHNRLSMPLKQIKRDDFLQERELQVLQQKQTIEVPLIQPSLEVTNITLAKWDMPKCSGSTSSSYVLRSSWMKVVDVNRLAQNDIVKIWSFRVQEKLCMALVKVIVS